MKCHFIIKLVFTVLVILFVNMSSSHAGSIYDIDFRNAEIKSAIRLLASMSGKNIVVPNKVDGKVTASFEKVDLDNAIESILRANGFGYFEENGVMMVTTQEDLAKLGGDLEVESFPLNNAKASDILSQIQSLVTERGSAVADERTNSIHVRDTRSAVGNIAKLIAKLDVKGQQVLIGAKLIEASVEFVRDLGIQWGITKSGGSVKVGGLNSVGTSDGGRNLIFNSPAEGARNTAPVGGLGLILGSFKGMVTDIQLSAAEEEGDISILSRPSITTLENQPAKIRSGVKFFIRTSGDVIIGNETTGTNTGIGSNLQQIETGVELKVTPQIADSGLIKLYIEATHSEADFSREVEGLPTILDSSADTTVILRDGETTIIGGLFRIRDAKAVKGVPGLMKIPLIGHLFKTKAKERSKSELLVFITPRIVDSHNFKLPHFSEPESAYRAAAAIGAAVDAEAKGYNEDRKAAEGAEKELLKDHLYQEKPPKVDTKKSETKPQKDSKRRKRHKWD